MTALTYNLEYKIYTFYMGLNYNDRLHDWLSTNTISQKMLLNPL